MDPDVIRMHEALVILDQKYDVPESNSATSPFTGTVAWAPSISLSRPRDWVTSSRLIHQHSREAAMTRCTTPKYQRRNMLSRYYSSSCNRSHAHATNESTHGLLVSSYLRGIYHTIC